MSAVWIRYINQLSKLEIHISICQETKRIHNGADIFKVISIFRVYFSPHSSGSFYSRKKRGEWTQEIIVIMIKKRKLNENIKTYKKNNEKKKIKRRKKEEKYPVNLAFDLNFRGSTGVARHNGKYDQYADTYLSLSLSLTLFSCSLFFCRMQTTRKWEKNKEKEIFERKRKEERTEIEWGGTWEQEIFSLSLSLSLALSLSFKQSE